MSMIINKAITNNTIYIVQELHIFPWPFTFSTISFPLTFSHSSTNLFLHLQFL